MRQIETEPTRRRRARALQVAQQAGRDVGGHQRTFDQQRAAAAHGIEQRAAFGIQVRPAAAHQHRCGQILFERRLALHLSPTAAMQRPAAQIDRQNRLAADLRRAHHQIQAQIGRFQIHVRPFAAASAQGVDHCVLDPLRGVARMGDGVAGHVRIHRQGHVGAQMLRPVDGGRARVQRMLIRAVVFGDRPQHAAGEPRPQHRALRVVQRAFHVRTRARRGGVRAAEREQLIDQKIFETLTATDEKFHVRNFMRTNLSKVRQRHRPRSARWWRGDGCREPSAIARGGCAPSPRPPSPESVHRPNRG